MSQEYNFILPIYVDFQISDRARSKKKKAMLARGKTFERKWLNLNWFRNAYFHEVDKAKKLFTPLECPSFFKADKIKVTYSVERKSSVKYDTMNVISIIDKFFLDWLVEREYIPDDNRTIVYYGAPKASGGDLYDRCLVTIEILDEQKPEQKKLF